MEKAAKITDDLKALESDIKVVGQAASGLNDASSVAVSAAIQFKRGAEQIARAADVQGAAGEQASRTIEEQNRARPISVHRRTSWPKWPNPWRRPPRSTRVPKPPGRGRRTVRDSRGGQPRRGIAITVQSVASVAGSSRRARGICRRRCRTPAGAQRMREPADVSLEKVDAIQKFLETNKVEARQSDCWDL